MRKTSLLKKCLSIALVWMASVVYSNAQVAVTVTGASNASPALSASYTSLSDAITALNLTTSFSGPVILACAAGSETAPAGGYSISFTGTTTITNTVTITTSGTVTITAPTPQTSGSLNDAIFKLIGVDYVTLSGFTMLENASNSTTAVATNNMTEFGVALFYASTTNGAQNNTIQNNIITLKRVYQNSIGIYSNTRHSATAVETFAEASSFAGSNSNNKVYGNTISNVNFAIVFYGTAASAAAMETGNDIGGSSSATGNTITNYGCSQSGSFGATTALFGTNASNTAIALSPNAAILSNHQVNENISYNSITSASLFLTSNLAGILKQHIFVTNPPTGTITSNINNNTVTINNDPQFSSAGQILAINSTAAIGLSSATININNNTVQNCVLGGGFSTTSPIIGINNTATVGTLNITGNVIRDLSITASSATSGSCTGITQTATSAILTNVNISGNTIYNLSTSGTTTGTATGISTNNNVNIFKNKIYGLSNTNTAGTAVGVLGISIFGAQSSITTNIYNNLIGNLTFPAANGTDAIRGIAIGATGTTSTHNVSFNTVYINASSSGTNFGTSGIFHAASTTSTTSRLNLRNNIIINTSTPAGTGLTVAYRRNNGIANMLSNYGSSSNNNLFYAGTPGASRLIYSDGTSSAQNITDYKNGVFTAGTIATRDAASISENTTSFLSTTGSSADFLHIDASITTGTEAGGVTVGGVSDDFDGESRPGTPDIGADQFGPVSVWDGSASTDFTTAANWDDNAVPASGANIGIPTGVSNKPQLTADRTIGKVTIGSGSFIDINGNTLTINGAVSGSGTITGSSTSNLTIGGAAGTLNFTSGGRTLRNLTLNASATATLGSALEIVAGSAFGTLTVGAGGTLTTGGNLTLKSDANGTAQVGNSAGSITGNVTVERYIPNTGRKWRLLTAPITGASNNTVFTNWQNNGTVNAGTGVAIWGTGGTCDPGVTAGNGLVLNAIGASSSMRRYNSSTNLWENVTNTVSETLFDGSGNKAFALFVTGHFGGAYTTVGSGSVATTLSATGSLITGSKAFNFTYEDNAEHIAMIGNPYASPVNFFNLTRTNVNDKFWVWDPSLDGTGGYVLLTGDGSGNYTPSIVSGYSGSAAAGTVYEDIQSGQAIFVEATAAGAASVTFEEADKVSTNHTQVFRNGTQTEKLRVNLLNAANPAAIKVVDGVLVQYSNSFSNGHAAEDGIKLYNDRENLWVDANGKEYMIEGRKLIDNSDTVKLTTWALQQQAYRLEIIGANFANDANLSAFLKDKFLGTETAISLSGTTEYPFIVTSDNNSKATDRFMVVFRSNASLPVTLTNLKAYQQNAGIAVEWNTQSESGMQQYEVEKSANGTNFLKVNTTSAKSGTTNSYNFFDATPFSGANYYRIKAISLNGDVKYSSIVVVRLNTKGTKVTVYPNPVKGDQINLELSGLEKGNYTVSLFNQLGQQVMNRSIQHNGTNATQTINIGTIPSGVYELRLANGTTAVTQKLIKE